MNKQIIRLGLIECLKKDWDRYYVSYDINKITFTSYKKENTKDITKIIKNYKEDKNNSDHPFFYVNEIYNHFKMNDKKYEVIIEDNCISLS